MSTRDLIDAIESSNSSEVYANFYEAIMSRVAERLDTMRIETAANMFKGSVQESKLGSQFADFAKEFGGKAVTTAEKKKARDEMIRKREEDKPMGSPYAGYSGKERKLGDYDPLSGRSYSESVEFDEELNEVLSKDAKASEWIQDFVDSDNPKFKGKSKKERTRMALGAYYAKQRNESVELDEARKLIGSYSEGDHTAKVYHLSGEHDEGDPYHVKLFKNGKHHEPADYFTDDKDDAHATAKHMIKSRG